MQWAAWVRYFFSMDLMKQEPEEVGKLIAQCKFIMKQKGYTFKS
jgi:hypothetical protein